MSSKTQLFPTHYLTLIWFNTVSTLYTKYTNSLLVIKHDVWEPDVGGGHVEAVHAPVLLRVPSELVIKPVLLYPQVSGHHLLPEVLGQRETLFVC